MLFSSRYNLQLHSVTHTNEKKHKCTVCSKAYSSKTSLQTHISTHSEDRPFSCSQCGKTFKNNRRLYVHKRSHETELKYECYTCGNKFKTKEYLKAHLYKHYKVKPFECSPCAKKFKHKKTWEKHMETKHLQTVRRKRKNDEITGNDIKKEKYEYDTNQEINSYENDIVNNHGELQPKENMLNLDVHIKMEMNGFIAEKTKNNELKMKVQDNYDTSNDKKTKSNTQIPDFVNVKVELNDE